MRSRIARPFALITRIALLTLLGPALASASDWNADPADSRLEFVGLYMEEDFEGHFERFTPTIRFDPNDLSTARFEVEIELASARTGDEEWDGYLVGADFFNAKQQAKARYTAEHFEATEAGFVAQGMLELRGISKPVALNFSFTSTDDAAQLVGTAELDRLDFGVGTGEWEDPELIGHPVRVRTTLNLSR